MFVPNTALFQITTNALKNLDSVSMAPPVNGPGHLLDVTALIVSKETRVMFALTDSKELVAKNAPLVSKGMIVKNVPLVSREIIVNNVHLVSKAAIVNNVLRDSRVAIVNNVCRTTTELIVVMILLNFNIIDLTRSIMKMKC